MPHAIIGAAASNSAVDPRSSRLARGDVEPPRVVRECVARFADRARRRRGGKVDGTGAASAQARQKSPIQSALASSSELHITIQEYDRDGRDATGGDKAAAQARNAASLRLAWVLRAAPPSLLFVEKDSIGPRSRRVAQELQAVSHNQIESDDDSDDDGFDPEKEKLKRREARCSRADLKRRPAAARVSSSARSRPSGWIHYSKRDPRSTGPCSRAAPFC